jgi:hypothetical protein
VILVFHKTLLRHIKSLKRPSFGEKHLKHNIHTLKLELSVGSWALNLREIHCENAPDSRIFFLA